MNVQEIVAEYLQANGYDGLYCEFDCCSLPDIMPCEGGVGMCQAGYIIPCPPDCGLECDAEHPHIGPRPRPLGPRQTQRHTNAGRLDGFEKPLRLEKG